jgi:hypothetical protein
MKLKTTTLALALAVASGGAFAQSAKFAAVYSENPIVTDDWSSVSVCEAILDASNATVGDTCTDGQVPPGEEDSNVATGQTMTTIKVPNQKELLVGVSAQIGLYTETVVRGKKGSTSSALAFAEGSVGLMACNSEDLCYSSVPREIVLSNRTQELEATLAGIIEDCLVDIDVTEDEFGDEVISGGFDLNACTVSPEEIGLALETLAAHHYNFVFPNIPVGEWEIIATFKTDAQTEAAAYCDPDMDPIALALCRYEAEASAYAEARAVINKAMVTVQEVRAVKGSLGMTLEFN